MERGKRRPVEKSKRPKAPEAAPRLAPLTLRLKRTVVDALAGEVASKALAALDAQNGTKKELGEVDVRESHAAGSGDEVRIEPALRMQEIVTRLRTQNTRLGIASELVNALQGLDLGTSHRKAQVGSLVRLRTDEGKIVNALIIKGGNGTRINVPGVGTVTCVSPESPVGIELLGTSSLEENRRRVSNLGSLVGIDPLGASDPEEANGVSKGDSISLKEGTATVEAIV